MGLFSDDAIVLRRLDYSESSQILAMLSRAHGILRLIAKGIKRGTKTRFAAAIDLLEFGHVVWSARPERDQALAILTEWKQVNGFARLRDDLSRLYAAQYAGEITCELLADADPHPHVFDALLELLDQAQSSAEPLLELCGYQRQLLTEIGLMPHCDGCVGCGREWSLRQASVYFSSRQGGFLCRDCEVGSVEKRSVEFATLERVATGGVTAQSAAAVFDLLDYHISHLMGKQPKLADYVLPARQRRKSGNTAN
jgi:DNA repair protein RecO (recombination protein O)